MGMGWFIASIILGFAYLGVVVSLVGSKLKNKNEHRDRLVIWFIFAVITVFSSIFCLRFAVNISVFNKEPLPVLEQFFNTLLQTFKIIDIDEEYGKFIPQLATFMEGVGISELWRKIWVVLVSLVDISAPILECVIALGILVNIFPKLLLWWMAKLSFRRIHYFSELNEGSFALAESLSTDSNLGKRKPVIVFTDAYADKEDEKTSELFGKAKKLGAICVRDDISHVIKPWKIKKKVYYYLVDMVEENNLQALLSLAEEWNFKYIKNKNIYVFVESNMYFLVESRFRDKLKKEWGFTDDELPKVKPVQIYRNLVSNLLVKHPLYEPIVDKIVEAKKNNSGEKTDLNVTILGNGLIGTETFLCVYWIGQMLDVNLKINVVSKDTKESFWNKINYINPEIKKTVHHDETQSQDAILSCDGAPSEYYAYVTYRETDIKEGKFWIQNDSLIDSDYFVVALGSDKDNISIAEKLRQCVGESHLKKFKETGERKKTVISYVVYDSNLCETLNREKRYFNVNFDSEKQIKTPDVFMYAFGSMKEIYNGRNVFMSVHSIYANLAMAAYSASQYKEKSDAETSERSGYIYDDYNYWANLAKAMHNVYKVASLGWINTSVFDAVVLKDGKINNDAVEDISAHEKQVSEACNAYKLFTVAGEDNLNDVKKFVPSAYDYDHLKGNRNRLAWLEHRRWNAFTRVMGFRQTTDYDGYNVLTGNHKHMELRLHPCLVECNENGERISVATIFNKCADGSFCICSKKGDKANYCANCELEEKCKENNEKSCIGCEKCNDCAECEKCNKAPYCQKLADRKRNSYPSEKCKSCSENKSCEYCVSKKQKSWVVSTHPKSELDELDKLSLVIGNEKNVKFSNFKEYDYYEYEFGSYLSVEKAVLKTDLTKEELLKLCADAIKKGKGVLTYGEGKYLIPKELLKDRFKVLECPAVIQAKLKKEYEKQCEKENEQGKSKKK